MLVLCCGMIRSGSTLQFNLARTLVERAGRGESVGWASEQGGQLSREQIEDLAADERMMVVKSHDLLGIDKAPLPEGAFSLLYSYRDIRDVAGSAKVHWDFHADELYWRLERALRAYDTARDMPNRLTQSYELLTEDGVTACAQINEFLGLGLDEAVVGEAAARWSRERVERTSAGADRENTVRRLKRAVRQLPVSGIMERVYRVLPVSLRQRLDPMHRDDSLMHDGHVSEHTKQGIPARAALTDEEMAHVLKIGGRWLVDLGYEPPAADGASAS